MYIYIIVFNHTQSIRGMTLEADYCRSEIRSWKVINTKSDIK